MSRTRAGTPAPIARIASAPAPTKVVNHKSMVPEPKCHDLAKWLSHYLYLLYFSFLLDLLHRKECRKVSHHKCHKCHKSQDRMSQGHVTWCHMTSHMRVWENSAQTMQQLYKQCRESNRNSIEFFLSTQIRSVSKSSQAKSLHQMVQWKQKDI